MAVAGFIDYVTEKTLRMVEDPDLDFDLASRQVRLIANFDLYVLRQAEARMGRRLFDDPGDRSARRAHKVLRLALERPLPETRSRA